jgi:aquaporin Z
LSAKLEGHKVNYKLFRSHLPEYLIEAWGLGSFMVAAGIFSTTVMHPSSYIHQFIPDPFVQRFLIGIAMGLTAIAITYSPWGKQSGAHLNPAVTLTFARLGKVNPFDALFYIIFQSIGGLMGILLVALLLGQFFTYPPIAYIATVPNANVAIAFLAEVAIAFVMMTTVLVTSNNLKLAPYTGLFAGFLVWLYVMFESPISGFGMNPARSLASAIPSGIWTDIWIYLTAPILGMLLGSEFYVKGFGTRKVLCAKLQHHNHYRCIHCDYQNQLHAHKFKSSK